jgi:hypothetical protein
MFKLKVQYFLSQEGLVYFPIWYEEVFKLTSQQDGFCNLSFQTAENEMPIVFLTFENEEKLKQWSSTEIHNCLADKIKSYFTQPMIVEIL